MDFNVNVGICFIIVLSVEVVTENKDNGDDNVDVDDDVDDDVGNGRRKLPTLLTLLPPYLRVIFAMMIPNLVVVQPIIAVYY